MLACVRQKLPFVQFNSEYRLNELEAMELLIALLVTDISMVKRKQSLKERELLLEKEKEKKTRKSTKPTRKK